MKMFTNATVNSMSQSSPGFAMANNFVQENQRPRGPPPPAPVETKNQPPPQRPGMVFTSDAPQNRPDINASRGTMFREQGVELNGGYQNVNSSQPEQQRSIRPNPPQSRPEMRGPQSSDIDNILSGLKTRNVNIHEQQSTQSNISMAQDDDSMLSISSLKDIQNGNMPKRTNRRKNRSDKNTISLDI
jgi:hypothetical protein